ncbi:zinc-dependent metalloprotease family protein [Polluticoccus soli]|uniref:zinc-dependent metalloprotease family protein n=1 Tax=Polluticoccus soli TaxID=3034150 RepID=UPI0023E3403A|nr:zinc-dependent metalloprotease family protein [Flavipsychrobacter sp. JY13-12]
MVKNLLPALLLFCCCSEVTAKNNDNLWQNATVAPSGVSANVKSFTAYRLQLTGMEQQLLSATIEKSIVVGLPTPDGRSRNFKVWDAPVMEDGLAAKYPRIKTYRGVAIDDPTVTVRMDITVSGFHAMVYDGSNTYLVDPSGNDRNTYVSYYKRDFLRAESEVPACDMASVTEQELTAGAIQLNDPKTPLKVNGTIRRTYRLALGATAQYSAAVASANLTKAAVLSAMVTTMNRVNGVYEKEVGVTMVLVSNTDDLIYLAEDDGYDNANGTTMLGQNQTKADAIIGSANYDIGHVFSTGGGGIASLGCVCKVGQKARGVTGQPKPEGDPFDIDYVAHEMGHQFGGNHTFNANFNAGSCTNNAVQSAAYEPGGGSTVMAYAGICGSANDVAKRSDDYFHLKSLDQITNYLVSGATCATVAPSNNTPPVVPSFSQTFSIPFLTPFELTAPEAVDADHDILTYCWEEWDLGDFGSSFAATSEFGPIFRSFKPTASRIRVFPTLDTLLKNKISYVGEKLPSVARTLNFRLTVRDVLNGYGTFNFLTDQITLNVVNTGIPFAVTSPNFSSNYWQIGTNVPVSWDVANTTASPINCNAVDILLSVDGGRTYPFTLASGTPNDGSETITVPFAPTTSARVKVKGSNNVFFDLSNESFSINTWPASIEPLEQSGEVEIYPVPAHDAVNVYIHNDQLHKVVIVNTLGQTVFAAEMMKQMEVDVTTWAKGVYHVRLVNTATKEEMVRKIVVD